VAVLRLLERGPCGGASSLHFQETQHVDNIRLQDKHCSKVSHGLPNPCFWPNFQAKILLHSDGIFTSHSTDGRSATRARLQWWLMIPSSALRD
jgi:hypothetical protein